MAATAGLPSPRSGETHSKQHFRNVGVVLPDDLLSRQLDGLALAQAVAHLAAARGPAERQCHC